MYIRCTLALQRSSQMFPPTCPSPRSGPTRFWSCRAKRRARTAGVYERGTFTAEVSVELKFVSDKPEWTSLDTYLLADPIQVGSHTFVAILPIGQEIPLFDATYLSVKSITDFQTSQLFGIRLLSSLPCSFPSNKRVWFVRVDGTEFDPSFPYAVR